MTTDTETNGQSAESLPESNPVSEEPMSQESQAIILSTPNNIALKQPFHKLPNNRPIAASDLDIVETRNVMGIRPIGANTFEIAHSDTLPGHRPVAASVLMQADTSRLPGHRPIASNEIDDPRALMGYLD